MIDHASRCATCERQANFMMPFLRLLGFAVWLRGMLRSGLESDIRSFGSTAGLITCRPTIPARISACVPPNTEAVEAFHARALALGARDEGAPAERAAR